APGLAPPDGGAGRGPGRAPLGRRRPEAEGAGTRRRRLRPEARRRRDAPERGPAPHRRALTTAGASLMPPARGRDAALGAAAPTRRGSRAGGSATAAPRPRRRRR